MAVMLSPIATLAFILETRLTIAFRPTPTLKLRSNGDALAFMNDVSKATKKLDSAISEAQEIYECLFKLDPQNVDVLRAQGTIDETRKLANRLRQILVEERTKLDVKLLKDISVSPCAVVCKWVNGLMMGLPNWN